MYVQEEYLTRRPGHMCIHHLFEYDGNTVSSTLSLSGDKIEQYYRIEREGAQLHFHPTASYVEMLKSQWEAMVARLQSAAGDKLP